jgi:glycosyltransferase involved in cell wall biosynthesis
MNNHRTISLCLTHWHNTELLMEAMAQVRNDARISEIIISDDFSDSPTLANLMSQIDFNGEVDKKIRLFRNDHNLGCYANKAMAIGHATNDYVIILDADNIIDRSYIDAIYACEWRPDTILQPEYAKPAFNFLQWSGMTITRANVAEIFITSNDQHKQFDCLLNAMNYFVHRQSYLEVWQDCPEPYAADTILQNYNWFKSGRQMFVTPGMQYYHRLHPGSHFLAHEKKSRELHKEMADKIKELR